MIDMFRELLNGASGAIPFAMSVNGKVKVNMARIMEMIIFAAVVLSFLFSGFEDIKADMVDVKEGQKEIQKSQENLKINNETFEIRLKKAEEEVKEIKGVVFEPINTSLRKRFEEFKKNNPR